METKKEVPQVKSLEEMFKTNPVYEMDGFVLDMGAFRVRLSRAGGSNKDFKKSFERHTRDVRTAARKKQLPEEVAQKRLIQVFAEAVIRSWETNMGTPEAPKWVPGIALRKGEPPIPFNKENVISTLEALPELFNFIRENAEDVENFQDEIGKEEDLKN